MNDKLENRNPLEVLDGAKISYSKSKEDVWSDLVSQIEESPKSKAKVLRMPVFRYAAVASVLILLGLFSFMHFYTIKIEASFGEIQTVTLPDGSQVELNSNSEIEYAPYSFWYRRKLLLKGEAYFQVKKGKTFLVESGLGRTQVLGTSFTILAQEDLYKVYCETGLVQVNKSNSKEEVKLKPGMSVQITKTQFEVSNAVEKSSFMSWREGKFFFKNRDLQSVLSELEMHYQVSISSDLDFSAFVYTGYFSRELSIQEALEIICYSFNFTFEETKSGDFIIIEN